MVKARHHISHVNVHTCFCTGSINVGSRNCSNVSMELFLGLEVETHHSVGQEIGVPGPCLHFVYFWFRLVTTFTPVCRAGIWKSFAHHVARS